MKRSRPLFRLSFTVHQAITVTLDTLGPSSPSCFCLLLPYRVEKYSSRPLSSCIFGLIWFSLEHPICALTLVFSMAKKGACTGVGHANTIRAELFLHMQCRALWSVYTRLVAIVLPYCEVVYSSLVEIVPTLLWNFCSAPLKEERIVYRLFWLSMWASLPVKYAKSVLYSAWLKGGL